MTLALDGIRVVDFSRIIAGPLCSQQLADLGADVIKIEHPVTGDEGRRIAGSSTGDDRGAFFQAFNRSKRSLALDLSTPAALEIVHKLLSGADVLIQNFRPGVMQRLKLDYDTLKSRYPNLIYLSISAYGERGQMAMRPGLDPVLQAEFGMMSITGQPDGPPTRTPLSLIDTMTALNASAAIMAALLARQSSGHGEVIELSLMDTAVSALGNIGSAYLNSGFVPARVGNQHMDAAPTNLVRTATQPIYAALATPKLFRTFCEEVVERPEWLEDERFATPAARSRNRQVLYDLMDEVMMTQSADYWLERMRTLPGGRIRTVDQALDSPEVAERDLVHAVPDGEDTDVRMIRLPFQFSETQTAPMRAAPHLGEHNDEILAELGYTSEDIASLYQQSVVTGKKRKSSD